MHSIAHSRLFKHISLFTSTWFSMSVSVAMIWWNELSDSSIVSMFGSGLKLRGWTSRELRCLLQVFLFSALFCGHHLLCVMIFKNKNNNSEKACVVALEYSLWGLLYIDIFVLILARWHCFAKNGISWILDFIVKLLSLENATTKEKE